MKTNRVAVWIDHNEAKIFHVQADSFETSSIGSPHHHLHRQPSGFPEGKTRVAEQKAHPADAKHFFDQVVRALEGAEAILIVGPATAKLELIRHLHQHARSLEPKVVGVETVDHPTDASLVAHARHYFKSADRIPRL